MKKRQFAAEMKTPIHEAAHAVAAEVLGYRAEVVKLTRRTYGYTKVHAPGRQDPLRIAMIAMAGHAADMKWFRESATSVPLDDARIVKRLGFSGRSCPTVVMLARGLVEEHADKILRVAEALAAARQLVRRDVRRIAGIKGRAEG